MRRGQFESYLLDLFRVKEMGQGLIFAASAGISFSGQIAQKEKGLAQSSQTRFIFQSFENYFWCFL
jgi:hypothetical protein